MASRGARQGDPLDLIALMEKTFIRMAFLKVFVLGKDNIHIPILQFVDDTLFFCKYVSSALDNLKQTIKLFEWCSGQKVNWDKSTLCGVDVDEMELLSTSTSLSCKAEHLPLTYYLFLAVSDR